MLLYMAHKQDQRTNVARVSITDIAQNVDMNSRQITRILQQLGAPRLGHPEGIIKRIHGGNGRGNVALYAFVEFGESQQKADISATKNDNSDTERVKFLASKGDISANAIRKERDFKENLNLRRIEAISSSKDSEDDEAVARIVDAFEQNPVTAGVAKPVDLAIIHELLNGHTVEQIEYGILLGSARKASSLMRASQETPSEPCYAHRDRPVQRIAYFIDAILEAKANPDQYTESYASCLRRVLRKYGTWIDNRPNAGGRIGDSKHCC